MRSTRQSFPHVVATTLALATLLLQMGITIGKVNAADQLTGSEQLIVAA